MDIEHFIRSVAAEVQAAEGIVFITFVDGKVAMSTAGNLSNENMAMGAALLLKMAAAPFDVEPADEPTGNGGDHG